MGRISRRIAREAKEEWLRRITGGEVTPFKGSSSSGRGADYHDAADQWVCNRKKAYPSEEMARRVANRMNEVNQTERAREGYFGVVVQPYACGRCGYWHLGR